MVRLTESAGMEEDDIFENFNSTMVRLTASPFVPLQFLLNQFQFHYGAIDSPSTEGSGGVVLKFQFHYGAIDSTHLLTT